MTLNHGFTTASQALLERFIRTAQHHPRRLTAAIAALFLSGTGGAFAVAALGPDPADLPVQTVQHPVQSLADGQTLAALTDSLAKTTTKKGIDGIQRHTKAPGVIDGVMGRQSRSRHGTRPALHRPSIKVSERFQRVSPNS